MCPAFDRGSSWGMTSWQERMWERELIQKERSSRDAEDEPITHFQKNISLFAEIPPKTCPWCHCSLCLTFSNSPYIDMLRKLEEVMAPWWILLFHMEQQKLHILSQLVWGHISVLTRGHDIKIACPRAKDINTVNVRLHRMKQPPELSVYKQ